MVPAHSWVRLFPGLGLVCGTGFQSSCICILVGGTGVQGFWDYYLSLVGRTEYQSLWWQLWCWCRGPGPGPTGLGCILRWLWSQRVLRQPACWWLGFCPHLASCWVGPGTCAHRKVGVLELLPTGWSVEVSPRGDELDGVLQSDSCQHQCPWYSTLPRWLSLVSISQGDLL